ncbi:UPF0175 family protein [Baaleninema sp.]|uniref:UPF0175 family protein n=1 Tax=Baaleninema sp. TaxID=3101197 RepID=UPI003CFFF3BF
MTNITIEFSDKLCAALQLSPDRLGDEIRLAAAMKLYELGKLSSGAASELAGIPKPVFLSKLSDYGIDTFDLTESELAEDVLNA